MGNRIKQALAVVATAFAFVMTAQAATVQTATKDWVRNLFRQQGIYVSGGTVTTNANGTLTFRSPCAFEDMPDFVALGLTTTKPERRTVARAAAPRARMAKAAPAAGTYRAANDTPGQVITMTILSGEYVSKNGTVWAWDFGEGLTLELVSGETLPEMPDATHFCELNADCNCVYSLMTKDERKAKAEEEYPCPDATAFFDPALWFDFDNWPADQIGGINGDTHYLIAKMLGTYGWEEMRLSIENKLCQSDAYRDAVLTVWEEVRDYVDDCRLNFIASMTCDQANPQHLYENKTCGGRFTPCRRSR